MKRLGKCNHCGACCAGCKLLVWRAVRDIQNKDIIVSGKDFISECLDYGGNTYKEKGCNIFPPQPASVPYGCGYYFEEDDVQ
jgi:hypothetical protein